MPAIGAEGQRVLFRAHAAFTYDAGTLKLSLRASITRLLTRNKTNNRKIGCE
jgi:hypothetical protein